jgi:hypothetical protein
MFNVIDEFRTCSSCAASLATSAPTTAPEFIANAVQEWISAV